MSFGLGRPVVACGRCLGPATITATRFRNLGDEAVSRNVGCEGNYHADITGQGSGTDGGEGLFDDLGGGTDTYTGPPGRADGVTNPPGVGNQGVFIDDG